jgi:hypothetical protein
MSPFGRGLVVGVVVSAFCFFLLPFKPLLPAPPAALQVQKSQTSLPSEQSWTLTNRDARNTTLYIEPINAGFDHVYVINLKKRKDRQVYMQELLVDKFGMSVEFFPAVDGHAPNAFIDHVQHTVKDRWGKVPQRGYVGSRMTHTNLLLDQISRDYETALVFEDDVIITDEVFAMHQDGECL